MLNSIARAAWRTAIPERFRLPLYRARQALAPRARVMQIPTYADDGLITQHVCDFLEHGRFMVAYQEARQNVPWTHPGEIHYRAYIACWAAERGLSLEGDFVECGVGHGIYSRTICSYLDFAKTGRRFFLFDTYAGIPTETALTDAERGMAASFNQSHYAGDMLGRASAKFAPFPNVQLVQGIVPQSLSTADIGRVAYLSIDMNNAAAEIGAIRYLWDMLVPGAIVLLDDYAYGESFRDQKRAWDAFAREKGVSILSLPTGQGMIIRP